MWNAISPGFELVSPCPTPAMTTITPRAPPKLNNYWWKILFWTKRLGSSLVKSGPTLSGISYHIEYSDYCPYIYCYNHNILADMSFSFPEVFHAEFRSAHKISNWALYLNHSSNSTNHDQVRMLSYSKYSLLF